MKQIPNVVTLLNLFFGCLAIVFALQNGITIKYDTEGAQFVDMAEKIWYASLFIGLAALVDFLDGFVARLFNAVSELGKQLDSLADVVSFGVAPAIIIYQFLRMSFIKQENGLDISSWWFAPAFILPCAAAYRLARFNLDPAQQLGFKGAPVPAVGLLVASLPLIYWYASSQTTINLMLNPWIWYGLILLLSYLMISKIPLFAFKFRDFSLRRNLPQYILIAITLLAFVAFKWLAVPLIFVFYIMLSLIFKKQRA